MKKRMAVWVVVLPLLVVFSTSLVGSALAAHSTTEMKAGALIPAHPENGKLVLFETGRPVRTVQGVLRLEAEHTRVLGVRLDTRVAPATL